MAIVRLGKVADVHIDGVARVTDALLQDRELCSSSSCSRFFLVEASVSCAWAASTLCCQDGSIVFGFLFHALAKGGSTGRN